MQERRKELDFGEKLTLDRLIHILPEVTAETRGFLHISEVPEIEVNLATFRDAAKRAYQNVLGMSIAFSIAVPSVEALQDKADQILGLQEEMYRHLQHSTYMVVSLAAGLFLANTAILARAYSKDDISSVIASSYLKKKKEIRIAANDTVSAIADVAHEYAHHIQYLNGVPMNRKYPLYEGHARGVEREVSRIFGERYDNPSFVYGALSRAAPELKDAYLFICNKQHRSPRNSLKKLKILRLRRGFDRFIKGMFEAHHYSIGVAAMFIAQAKYGNRVYREVVNNDYAFLRI